MFFSLLVLLSYVCICHCINIENVRACFERAVSSHRWKKKVSGQFHLHYGDAVVELFNVLSTHDIKSLEHLAACVIREDSGFYEEFSTTMRFRDDKHLGVGNITHLTGVVGTLMPDLLQKISLEFLKSLPDLHWHDYYRGEQLGIRSARFVSADTGLKMMTANDIAKMRAKDREAGDAFVIAPPDKDGPVLFDEDADENIQKFLKRDYESKFSVYIFLTPRGKFTRGNIVAQKVFFSDKPGQDGQDGDEYEDEEEEEAVTEELITSHLKHKHATPRFHAMRSKFGRYIADKGNVLVVRSDCLHGVSGLGKGYRNLMVLELWPYQDAPPPSDSSAAVHARASILDAKPFPKKVASTEL